MNSLFVFVYFFYSFCLSPTITSYSHIALESLLYQLYMHILVSPEYLSLASSYQFYDQIGQTLEMSFIFLQSLLLQDANLSQYCHLYNHCLNRSIYYFYQLAALQTRRHGVLSQRRQFPEITNLCCYLTCNSLVSACLSLSDLIWLHSSGTVHITHYLCTRCLIHIVRVRYQRHSKTIKLLILIKCGGRAL